MSPIELSWTAKKGYFTVRLIVSVDPPPYGELFGIFFVFFFVSFMIICVLKLLEFPIPPPIAAALRCITRKRQAPSDYHLQEADPSF